MPSIVADIENLKRELERAHSELLQPWMKICNVSLHSRWKCLEATASNY